MLLLLVALLSGPAFVAEAVDVQLPPRNDFPQLTTALVESRVVEHLAELQQLISAIDITTDFQLNIPKAITEFTVAGNVAMIIKLSSRYHLSFQHMLSAHIDNWFLDTFLGSALFQVERVRLLSLQKPTLVDVVKKLNDAIQKTDSAVTAVVDAFLKDFQAKLDKWSASLTDTNKKAIAENRMQFYQDEYFKNAPLVDTELYKMMGNYEEKLARAVADGERLLGDILVSVYPKVC